jgi:hypothetical protein
MLEIAVELAANDRAYEELATNVGMQFLLIARAMNGIGPDGMWDQEDGFYYDVLRTPDGNATRLKVRSMVGLLPLCARTVVEKWQRQRVPFLTERLYERFRRMPELRESIHATGPGQFGVAERSTRTNSSARTESGHCPGITQIIPMFLMSAARNTE